MGGLSRNGFRPSNGNGSRFEAQQVPAHDFLCFSLVSSEVRSNVMRTKHAFLAGAAVAVACLMIGNAAAFADPGFSFNGATVHELVYTYNGLPASCVDYPAASDYYVWNLQMSKINQNFILNLKNRIYITALASGTCNPLLSQNVTTTTEIPWQGPAVGANPVGPIFFANFVGAVPDFNLVNNSNDVLQPFYALLGFQLKFNNNVGGAPIQGLNAKSGVLQVYGNANLCETLLNGGKQCFLLDLNYDDFIHSRSDLACTCAKPSIEEVDITQFLTP
jgi:hypothetical protein